MDKTSFDFAFALQNVDPVFSNPWIFKKESCKNCNESFSLPWLPKHEKMCYRYHTFLIQLDNNGNYWCKLCSIGFKKRLRYSHMKENHPVITLRTVNNELIREFDSDDEINEETDFCQRSDFLEKEHQLQQVKKRKIENNNKEDTRYEIIYSVFLIYFCIDRYNFKNPDFRFKLGIPPKLHNSLNNNHGECQELKTLFMCQVCQRFFLNTKDTRNHIQNTHHIPKEVQNKMTSLSAIEIPLRTTSGMFGN